MFLKYIFPPKSVRIAIRINKLKRDILKYLNKAEGLEILVLSALIRSFAESTMSKSSEIIDKVLAELEEEKKQQE